MQAVAELERCQRGSEEKTETTFLKLACMNAAPVFLHLNGALTGSVRPFRGTLRTIQ